MGLKDRINDEMVVDAESVLDEHFEQGAKLFRIFEDGSIDIEDDFKDAPWREHVLIYLIGQRYAFEGDRVEKPTLAYEFFYGRIDKDDSTIRAYMNELDDDLLVKKHEDSGEWQLVPDNLPQALANIEGLVE